MNGSSSRAFHVLVANPGSDVYGSDLQMLESVSAMVALRWRVTVAVPGPGPLVDLLKSRGADVLSLPFPVVRRGDLSPGGVARLATSTGNAFVRLRRVIKDLEPDVLYVNTITIPVWLLAARISRTASICHVHEAENSVNRVVLKALYAPLLLATNLVVNSSAALDVLVSAVSRLRDRTALVYNGVPGPPHEPAPHPGRSGEPFRLAVVGRLSPRKAPDVALEALSLLRAEGREVQLDVCGSTFEGYEWYAAQLRERADQPDLSGSVIFSGYQSPVWPALERCHAVVAPSLREPFGNAVVEAQLALRPVVATAALGHLETVQDGCTGLLVPPGDAPAMARGVARLMDESALALTLAEHGRRAALDAFSVERYSVEITARISAAAAAAQRPNPQTARVSLR